MAPYHYVLIFWAVTLIYGLLRAFYEAGYNWGRECHKIEYRVFMIDEGFGKFRFIHDPFTPEPEKQRINYTLFKIAISEDFKTIPYSVHYGPITS